MDIINFITSNAEGIIAILVGAHVLALAVVNLTPTPKDDAIVAKIYKIIEFLAGLVTSKAKDPSS